MVGGKLRAWHGAPQSYARAGHSGQVGAGPATQRQGTSRGELSFVSLPSPFLAARICLLQRPPRDECPLAGSEAPLMMEMWPGQLCVPGFLPLLSAPRSQVLFP